GGEEGVGIALDLRGSVRKVSFDVTPPVGPDYRGQESIKRRHRPMQPVIVDQLFVCRQELAGAGYVHRRRLDEAHTVHTGVCCIMRSQVIFTARFAVRAFLAQPREPNETSQSTAGGTPSGFASKISRQDRVGSLNATDPFQIVPEKKSIKNRIQIDVNASVAARPPEIPAP